MTPLGIKCGSQIAWYKKGQLFLLIAFSSMSDRSETLLIVFVNSV